MILTGTGIIRGVGNSVSYNVVALNKGPNVVSTPATSPILTNDGVNWVSTTSVSTPTIWPINSILYSNASSNFVICAGRSGKEGWSYSSDGRIWTKSSTVTTREQLVLIEKGSGPNLYRLVSLANSYSRYSTDGGLTWSAETSYSLAGGATHIPGTGVYNQFANRYISAGSGTNRVMYSSDGSNWTGVTIGSQNFIGGFYENNGNNAVFVSTGSMIYGNGATMTLGSLSGDTNFNITSIAYSPTQSKAIATTTGTTGYIGSYTGLGGITSLFPVIFNRIIWSTALSKWIGFGATTVYTSPAGLAGTWTLVYTTSNIISTQAVSK